MCQGSFGRASISISIFIDFIDINMFGQITIISFLILGTYLFASWLKDIGNRAQQETSSVYEYHLGCYEADKPLNQSKIIENYLRNLSDSLAPYSVEQVLKHEQYISQQLVSPKGANEIALEFKRYIIAYENIRNLNEYEKIYNKGIRQARDRYQQCRGAFLSKDWHCQQNYEHYLQSEEEFNIVKEQLTQLIAKKYQEQRHIEKLLAPQNTENAENQTYHRIVAELNAKDRILRDSLKEQNETLIGLENKEFKLSHDLNSVKNQLDECQKNKKQLQTCKTIGQKLQAIIKFIDPKDLLRRIQVKQVIIEDYQKALAKRVKLGRDTTESRKTLIKNKEQFNDLLALYNQVQTAGVCAGDLIKKCSDDHIEELKSNITSIEYQLKSIANTKRTLRLNIDQEQKQIEEINELKRKATEDYQNSIGSLEHLRELEAQNLKKLKIHRDNINSYNIMITNIQKDIEIAENKRRKAINGLDDVLGRVSELTNCLSKKDYLIKLQNKRPQRSNDHNKLKREAAQKLIKVIRSVYV